MIYFVGMHNKPGKLPFDSSTYSGKIIDSVIAEVVDQCANTNLADVDFLPQEPLEYAIDWHHRINPAKGDIIVLLGKWVQHNFLRHPEFKHIEMHHPASFYVRRNRSEYIKRLAFFCNFT